MEFFFGFHDDQGHSSERHSKRMLHMITIMKYTKKLKWKKARRSLKSLDCKFLLLHLNRRVFDSDCSIHQYLVPTRLGPQLICQPVVRVESRNSQLGETIH